MSFLHADYAESAEFFIFFSVLRWRWRGRKLRYDERAQRRERLVFSFHHTPSPSGLPLSQGEKASGICTLKGGVIWGHRVSRRDEVCDIFCGLPFV